MSDHLAPLIDAHCHPEAFARDEWKRVVESALQAGVQGCLAAGVWWDDFERLNSTCSTEVVDRVQSKVEFFRLFEDPTKFRVMASLGLHPMEIARRWRTESGDFDQCRAEQDAAEFCCVARAHSRLIWAIGETGFDASRDCLKGWRDKQQLLKAQDFGFEVCLAVALELSLPLILHSRAAWGHTLERLKTAQTKGLGKFMVHCYPGPASDLPLLRRIGGFASFGGVLTWPNAIRMREAMRLATQHEYLLETDSPDLAPVLPGSEQIVRNEPRYLSAILSAAAQLRGESREEVAQAHFKNLARYLVAVE
jgi:TatD family hydrolase